MIAVHFVNQYTVARLLLNLLLKMKQKYYNSWMLLRTERMIMFYIYMIIIILSILFIIMLLSFLTGKVYIYCKNNQQFINAVMQILGLITSVVLCNK